MAAGPLPGMDRNALRPLRFTLTPDDLLDRRLRDRHGRRARDHGRHEGPPGPGPDDRRRSRDRQGASTTAAIKDRIAAERPYAAIIVKGFRTVDDLPPPPSDARRCRDKAELTRRQVAANLTLEDMELILAPMVETAKEAIGSMGDDTPARGDLGQAAARSASSSGRISARSPTRRSTRCANAR